MTSSSQHNSFFLFSEGGGGGSGEGVVIFIYGKGMLIKYQMYRFAHTPLCVGDASRFYRTRRSIQRKTPFFPSLRALLSLSMAMAMIMSSLTADIDAKKVMKMRQSDAADGTLLAEGWELPTRSVFLFCIVFFCRTCVRAYPTVVEDTRVPVPGMYVFGWQNSIIFWGPLILIPFFIFFSQTIF